MILSKDGVFKLTYRLYNSQLFSVEYNTLSQSIFSDICILISKGIVFCLFMLYLRKHDISLTCGQCVNITAEPLQFGFPTSVFPLSITFNPHEAYQHWTFAK